MLRILRTRYFMGATIALTAAAALSACGGGGGGGGMSGGTPSAEALPPAPPPNTSKPLAAACTGCGAVDGNTYAGSGTGVWQASNDSTVPADFPISIAGIKGQLVTLVFTNESAAAVTMPALPIFSGPTQGKTDVASKTAIAGDDVASKAKQEISEFNRSGFSKLLGSPAAKSMFNAKLVPQAPTATYTIGQQRSIYLEDKSQRTVQLAGQKATGDGTMVNVWVEATELDPNRVSTALADRMRDAFAGTGGIYDMLVKVGGPLWGNHAEPSLIAAAGQPIDIFFVNFDSNGLPYGLGGYFWALNNFKKDAGVLALSNESVSMYMDTETMYLGGEDGVKQVATALAHEGMHMQNFYRRGVTMGAEFTYDLWLEEMTAMMMEDWASFGIDQTHNAIRDVRYPTFMTYHGAGSYNCALTTWLPMGAECESYAVNGSFGGYLNRQFGLGFFKALLNSTGIEDSEDILNAAIKAQRSGSNISTELRQFAAASTGLVALNAGIAEYSMPARIEDGFTLVAVDPAAIDEDTRRLPSAVPAYLQPLASFPVSRFHREGTYTETVRVPPGTTLTVVIN
jgi:hypothetical protein